ncbi:hypothetical protein BDQ17DRAFT_1302352 [Cyathus striatus]|nr:hypothetical protein BDQ17DRAFT_1302352 [Cyathus striatus]
MQSSAPAAPEVVPADHQVPAEPAPVPVAEPDAPPTPIAPEIRAAVMKEHDDAANESTDEVFMQTTSTEAEKKVSREEVIATRAEKRAAKLADNHLRAEEAAKEGDEHFEKGENESALTYYLGAVRLWSSNPTFYSKLAAVYIKLEFYEDAAHAATRALTLDPQLIEARYQRGIARLEQRLLRAAKIDFETILAHDSTHAASTTSLAQVDKLIESSHHLGTHSLSADPIDEAVKDLDFSFPHYEDDKLEIASVSDSSDCNHVGNGVPCRFYNHAGCSRGAECMFSHAPDEKSVRDDLGRNVCIYYLLDSCKFGSVKCVYAHSKECLPKKGWWTSAEETKKVKEVLEMAEKSAREQRALESLLRKLHSHKKRRGGKGKKDTKKDEKEKKEEKDAQKEDKKDAEKAGEKDEAKPAVPSAAKESTSASPAGEKKKKVNRRSKTRKSGAKGTKPAHTGDHSSSGHHRSSKAKPRTSTAPTYWTTVPRTMHLMAGSQIIN